MPEEYIAFVAAVKGLQQADDPNGEPVTYHTLPMAENEWNTRPDTVSYGIVRLDFEASSDTGDDLKASTAYEGSLDLFSMEKRRCGDGEGSLHTEHTEAPWGPGVHNHSQ